MSEIKKITAYQLKCPRCGHTFVSEDRDVAIRQWQAHVHICVQLEKDIVPQAIQDHIDRDFERAIGEQPAPMPPKDKLETYVPHEEHEKELKLIVKQAEKILQKVWLPAVFILKDYGIVNDHDEMTDWTKENGKPMGAIRWLMQTIEGQGFQAIVAHAMSFAMKEEMDDGS